MTDAEKVAEARESLRWWQRFAGYCRSCALSGEYDPLTFDDFVLKSWDVYAAGDRLTPS